MAQRADLEPLDPGPLDLVMGHNVRVSEESSQHSIRINDQWRICFRWTAAGPEDVEIADYH